MKSKLIVFIAFMPVILSGCGSRPSTENVATAKPSPAASSSAAATPAPSPSVPKNGDYNGKGVVTKINLELGSVELDHEEVKGAMPAMKMEFYVTDKKMLDGLKVGDNVDFVLRYKDYTETIANIKKAQ